MPQRLRLPSRRGRRAFALALSILLSVSAISAQQIDRVADLNPGAMDSDPDEMVRIGGEIFVAAAGNDDRELWATDGTLPGTRLVRNIDPDDDSRPEFLVELDGNVLFNADDGENGRELWISDGTPEGTQMVVDLSTVTAGSIPEYLVPSGDGDFVFFKTTFTVPRLWRTDGTEAGTFVLSDASLNLVRDFFLFKDVLYFRGNIVGEGDELWRSDGTPEGTYLVADIYEGAFGSTPAEYIEGDGTLYFTAEDADHGRELWKTDGTTAGTQLVADICPGPCDGFEFVAHMVFVDGLLYFQASDGETGDELWSSDGTEAGTQQVADLCPGSCEGEPENLAAFDGRVYFEGKDTSNLFGSELWRTDGTEAGTELVKEIRPGPNGGRPDGLTVVNGLLLFAADDGLRGRELWTSDGTEEGTTILADLNPTGSGIALSDYFRLQAELDGRYYLSLDDGTLGEELYTLTVPALLEVSGVCPGEIALSLSGALPNAEIVLVGSPDAGGTLVPQGPCAGTEIGLDSPSLLGRFTADESGALTLSRSLAGGACELLVQALDEASCLPSRAVAIAE